MTKKFISLMLAIMLVCTFLLPASAVAIDRPDNYTITTPYAYPVLPGTDEWQSLTMDERVMLSHVDEDVAEDMTTEAVLSTTLSYPFIINIFAYGKVEDGINVVKGYCSPLAELLMREDALYAITTYLFTSTDTDSVEYYVAEKLWSYVNSFTASAPRYIIDPTTGERAGQVRTPNGSVVLVIVDRDWDYYNTTYEEQRVINAVLQNAYGAVPVRDINPSYNCHSYAWYSTSTSNHYWMDDPFKYIADGSYVTGTGAVGNRITYNTSTSTYTHSGIVTSPGIITSKWGALGLFEHTVSACPYYVQNISIYYWQRS